MSLWNHYGNYTDQMYETLNSKPDCENRTFPRCPEDIHEFWEDWIGRSYFDWEEGGRAFRAWLTGLPSCVKDNVCKRRMWR